MSPADRDRHKSYTSWLICFFGRVRENTEHKTLQYCKLNDPISHALLPNHLTNFSNMGLNLSEIDRLLNDWNRKVDAANQNLLELADLSAYQRVSGMGNPPSNLTGFTQEQVSIALTAIDRLFEDLQLLNQSIDRAKQLRRKLPSLFISDENIQEIERILIGNSIQLPSKQMPLSQRNLLSNSQQLQTISLTELLARMMDAFKIARDTFVTLETAWTELERKLIVNHQSLIDLQQLAQQLQIPISADLSTAQTNFANLQLQIDRDPLGVNHTFDREIAPSIDRARQELLKLHHQSQQIQTELIAAREKLTKLCQLEQDSIAAYTASQTKIIHNLPTVPPLPAAEMIALEEWLTRLETKFQAGIVAPVHIGLTNWFSQIEAYLQTGQSALAANQLPLDTRQELRGRLEALTAKALAKGQAEDPILADLAVQARQVLYTSPTALDLGMSLVERYQQYLDRQLAC
jgi:hypothetical protein